MAFFPLPPVPRHAVPPRHPTRLLPSISISIAISKVRETLCLGHILERSGLFQCCCLWSYSSLPRFCTRTDGASASVATGGRTSLEVSIGGRVSSWRFGCGGERRWQSGGVQPVSVPVSVSRQGRDRDTAQHEKIRIRPERAVHRMQKNEHRNVKHVDVWIELEIPARTRLNTFTYIPQGIRYRRVGPCFVVLASSFLSVLLLLLLAPPWPLPPSL